MARIIIIGEGQTEQEFCNDVLQPHFNSKNIYLQNATIKKTGGGIVGWEALKHQIENHLKQDREVIVTLLIDYYGIKPNHNYPNWDEALAVINNNKYEAIGLIENGMLNDVDSTLRNRFIPYIQLHEFEGLLFSKPDVFLNNFEPAEFKDLPYLNLTVGEYDNPEMINDGPQTAPSKRLKRILTGYDKIVYGSLLAQEIGLETIREKCLGFSNWIGKLENI